MKRPATIPKERRVIRPQRQPKPNVDFPEMPDFETVDIIGPGYDRPDGG